MHQGHHGMSLASSEASESVNGKPALFLTASSGNQLASLLTEYGLSFTNLVDFETNRLYSPTFIQTQSNYQFLDDLNANEQVSSRLEGVRFAVLIPLLPRLKALGLPGNVASDMLMYYFSSQVCPSCKVSSILRKKSVLTLVDPEQEMDRQPSPVRQCLPLLVLLMLTAACFDINHFFMTGHKRRFFFAKLMAAIELHLTFDPHNEDQILNGTFDDVITCTHVICFLPLLGNPALAHLWLRRAAHLAKQLEINREVLTTDVTEEYREERRRCWWTLYILDKHLGIALNTQSVIYDQDSTELYHPCQDQIYDDINTGILPSPYEQDLTRPKGIQFTIIGPGVFGWMLPLYMIVSALLYYKTYILKQRKLLADSATDSPKSDLEQRHENSQGYSETFKQKLQDHLAVYEANLPSLLQYSIADHSYAEAVCSILSYTLTKDVYYWEPKGLFAEDLDFDKALEWRCRYSEAFVRVLNNDSDMRGYPLLIRLYLFFASVDVINLLGGIDKEIVRYRKMPRASERSADALTKLCHTVKRLVSIIVRCVESCMVTLPVDYLRVVRNCLMEAMRDMDYLLIMKGYGTQFEINRENRRKLLSVYSFVVNGQGVGL